MSNLPLDEGMLDAEHAVATDEELDDDALLAHVLKMEKLSGDLNDSGVGDNGGRSLADDIFPGEHSGDVTAGSSEEALKRDDDTGATLDDPVGGGNLCGSVAESDSFSDDDDAFQAVAQRQMPCHQEKQSADNQPQQKRLAIKQQKNGPEQQQQRLSSTAQHAVFEDFSDDDEFLQFSAMC